MQTRVQSPKSGGGRKGLRRDGSRSVKVSPGCRVEGLGGVGGRNKSSLSFDSFTKGNGTRFGRRIAKNWNRMGRGWFG